MERLHHRPLKEVHPFISKSYHYAIVGASANPEKYGNIVFFDLKNDGFMVIPVNPKLKELGGVTAYPNLQSVLPVPDVAVVIVPPPVGPKVVEDAAAAGIRKLWFQPGAESQEIRDRARALGLDIMADGSCIMVVRRQMGEHLHQLFREEVA